MPANNSDKCTTIMAAVERELGGKPAAESSSKLLLRTTADPEWVCCSVELFSSVDKSPKQVERQGKTITPLGSLIKLESTQLRAAENNS